MIALPLHCLKIKDFNKPLLLQLFKQADHFIHPDNQSIAIPDTINALPLQGMTVANCFFEPSTRTRSSFELAAKYLGANVLNFAVSQSAQSKGETLLDTLHTLESMAIQCFVIRHKMSGAVHFLAQNMSHSTHVINAGDGYHEHPTQALLDMYTLWRLNPDFSKRRVAIVGDIMHSRVVRSQIYALTMLGVEDIRVIAPPSLLPCDIESLGVRVYHDLLEGLDKVNTVVALRLQKERMESDVLPSLREFQQTYGIDQSILASVAPKAVVMHPGPVNRGVELSSQLVDAPQSVIRQQVTHGVAVRMALLMMLLYQS